MTTKAHNVTQYIASAWEDIYASAVLSGIVGDASHQANGGYHISIEDNSSSNYSVTRPDDKAPPGTWPRNLAAAIDMSMDPNDMKLCSSNLWNAWYDQTDPRRNYINGFNGWFNDGGPAKRYDFVSQAISDSSSDHKWHVHLEIRRKYVTDSVAAEAILSILRGESKAQFLAGGTGDDMFCKFGETSEKVKAMQLQLLQLDPGCLPRFGADSNYGQETADALSRIVIGGEAKVYDAPAWAMMQKLCAAKNAPAGEVINWPLKATIIIPETTITIPASSIEADVVERG